MVTRKFLIFCLIMGALMLSMGCVSAGDSNESMISTDSNMSADSDMLADSDMSADSDMLADSDISLDTGSFNDLNDLIEESTNEITLNRNYTYNPDTDADYETGITIEKDLTIDGNGYTLNGNFESRIFYIWDSTVVLKNINFINAEASWGGAICSDEASLVIINSSFINNCADEFGGAISSEWGSLEIINSSFINNCADEDGGAIYVENQLNVINSSFVNNSPNNICPGNKFKAYLTVDLSSKVIDEGDVLTIDVYTSYGATGNVIVAIDGKEYFLDLVDYHAQLNVSDLSAGSHKVTSVYSGNDVYKSNAVESIFGVIGDEGIFILADDIFYGEDLAIDVYVGGNATGEVLVFVNGIVYSSVVLNGNTGKVVISNLSAGTYEIVAIFNDASDSCNVAVNDYTYTFKDLQDLIDAASYGSTIFLEHNYIFDEAIDTNYEYDDDEEDAFININKPLTIDGNGHILDGNGQVRIMNIGGNNVVLNNLTFRNGNSYVGGAIYVYGDDLTLNNCIFENNHAWDDGGVIYATNSVDIFNSIFINNTGGWCGNVYAYSANVVDSTFINNHADEDGGAIYVNNQLNINNSIFVSNSAYQGGAIRSNNNVNIANSLFENNYASENAVIYASTHGDFEIVNCSFVNNTADNNYLFSCPIDSNIENCTFEGNSNIQYMKKTMSIYCYIDDEEEYTYFDSIPVYLEVNSDVNTTALIYINDNYGNFTSYKQINITSKGNYSFTLNELYPGSYDMMVEIAGNDFYETWQGYYYFNVNKLIPAMNVDVGNIMYGESLMANISMNYNITGHVTVNIGSKKYTVQLVNGKSSLIVSDLTPGTYNIDVVYSGDSIYESADASASFLVMENGGIYISAKDIVKGEDLIVNINLGGNATGEVLVYVNGNVYPVVLYGNTGKVVISNLSIGTYEVVAIFNDASDSCNITVNDYTYTFKDLQDLIYAASSGSTIVLEHNYIYDKTIDEANVTSINIFKQITIEGNGHTLDGNNQVRIMNIGSNVVLNNLTFQNGHSYDRGGAIYVYGGDLTLNDCIFENNYAEYSGGALQCMDGKISIVGSTFINNIAEWEGGILHIDSNYDVTIINSTFINNTAHWSGGCVHAGYSNITAINSVFINNHADWNGGALESRYTINVTNSTFIANSARDGGGAISASSANVVNSSFVNNTPNNINPDNTFIAYLTVDLSSDVISAGDTVTIDVYTSYGATGEVTIKIDDEVYVLTLVDYHAQLNVSGLSIGSYTVTAVYSGNDVYKPSVAISVIEVIDDVGFYIFANDVEYGEDLVIDFYVGENATGKVSVVFNGEEYSLDLVDSHAQLTVSNLEIGEYDIYATYMNSTKVTTVNVYEHVYTFTELQALIDAAKSGSTIVLEHNCIYDEYRDDGSISINKAITIDGNGHIINGNNQVRIMNVNNAVLRNITFINGYSNEGGAIQGSGFTLDNCVFINNVASSDGGAIYADGFTLDNCMFENNTAGSYGGAIYNNWALFTVNNCLFIDNVAGSVGSAIHNNWATFSIINSTFEYNYGGGAAVDSTWGELSVINCTFTNNEASSYYSSAAIGAGSTAISNIVNSSFINNTPFNIPEGKLYDAYLNVDYSSNLVYLGDVATIDVYTSYGATGRIHVLIEGDIGLLLWESELVDYHAQLDVSFLPVGHYTVTVVYLGNDVYKSINMESVIDVIGRDGLYIIAPNIDYGEDLVIDVYVGGDANGTVSLTFDGTEYGLDLINNHAQLTIPNLEIGNYTIYADYMDLINSTTVSVNKHIGTFTELQELINNASSGDIINLECDYIYDFFRDSGSISINKALTINGNGHILDGNHQTGIMNINSYVAFNNIVFINGYSENGRGCGIYSNSDFSVFNCSFINNCAPNEYGSAIYTSSCSFDVVNSIFVNNSGDGAAIDTTWGSYNVINCTFINNTASDSYTPGAITGGSGTTINVVNSSFINNSPFNVPSGKSYKAYVTVDLSSNVISLGDVATIDVYTSYGATGYIEVLIGGDMGLMESWKLELVDYHAQLNVSDLPVGSYKITVVYSGNDVYKSSTEEYFINVIGDGLYIFAKDIDYGEDLVADVYVGGNATGTVNVIFNGTEYKLALTEGHAQLTIPNLEIGDYTIHANYMNLTNVTTVNVHEHVYTFTELQEIINKAPSGGTVILEHDCIYDENIDEGSISINKRITIDGNGHIIDGNNQVRIMYFEYGAVLRNIKFINGYSDYGGAINCEDIYGNGSRVENCVFVNNTATRVGGAIYGGGLTFDNCMFESNAAGSYAGAIYNRWGSLTVNNCLFLDNTARYTGNAIYHEYGNLISLINSTFVNNSGRGAAVYTYKDLSVENCVFINNSASNTEDAGAISLGRDVTVNIENSIFINNTPRNIYPGLDPEFTIDLSSYILSLGDTLTVDLNTRNDTKGRVYLNIDDEYDYVIELIDGHAQLNISYLSVGSHILTAQYEGNDIYGSSAVSMEITVISGNIDITAKDIEYGEDLVVDIIVAGNANGTVTVMLNGMEYSCALDYNHANLIVSGLSIGKYNITVTYGDWVAAKTVSVNEHKYTFRDLQAIFDGIANGTIQLGPENTLELEHDYIYDSSVDKGSLVIEFDDYGYDDDYDDDEDWSIVVVPFTINGNGHTIDGNNQVVIFDVYCSYIIIFNNITFINGANDEDLGCAILIWSDIMINNCNFINNSAIGVGDSEFMAINNCTFINNSANEGGAIYSQSNHIQINNCTFINNSADNGGAINFYVWENSLVSIDNSLFINNDARGYGGAIAYSIYMDEPGGVYSFDITNSVFRGNVAGIDGGAIYIYSGEVNVTDTIFEDNRPNDIGREDSNIILVWANEISYGQALIVNVYSKSDSYVNVSVNGMYYSVDLNQSVGILEINGLNAGNYEITVYGENKYNSTNVTVNKADSIIDFSGDIVYVGNPLVMNLNIGYDATGSFTVFANNRIYSVDLINGSSSVSIEGLPAGENVIFVDYSGDENYLPSNITIIYHVFKHDAIVSIYSEDITYGENLTVGIFAPDDSCGEIMVILDEDLVAIINGTDYISIPNLSAGEYLIDVMFSGDDKYYPVNVTSTVTVNKKATYINATNAIIDFGEDLIIDIALSERINDVITVMIGGATYRVRVSGGAGQLIARGINAGEYNATVTYNGNANFLGSQTISSVVVKQIDPQLNVSMGNIVYGDDLVVDIQVHPSATGNVIVIVGSEEYSAILAGGKAQIRISDLAAGNYSITTTYGGDINFINVEVNNPVTVDKKETFVYIEAREITYGEDLTINVDLSESINENVIITFDDVNYTVELVNGAGKLTLSDLTAGNYMILAKYEGNQNLTDSSADSSVTVKKLALPIDIFADDITYGEDLNILAILGNQTNIAYRATGEVLFFINGKAAGNTVLANASANVLIEDLMPGIYNITVVYSGDQNFFNASNAAGVTVKKLNSDISVNASDITYGEDLIIDVESSIETGVVKAKINDNEYSVNLTDGKGQFVVSMLNAGNYTITVTYLENELYYSSNSTSQVTVNKKNSTISVTASDISYGENVVLNIDLTAGATGNLLISYGDTNRTIAIKTVEHISGLDAGNYDIAVSYLGDNNFNPIQTTCSVVVNQIDPQLNVSVGNIVYGDDLVVDIQAHPSATGNVTVVVGSEEYSVILAGGKAQIRISDLAAGNYSITTTYGGDINFINAEVNNSATVNKKQTFVYIEAMEITYGEDLTINVALSESINENLIITFDDVNYTVELVNGTGQLSFSDLTAGNYMILAKYEGNQNLTDSSADSSVTVKKLALPIDIFADDITYGEDLNILAILGNQTSIAYRATGDVSFSIDGNVVYNTAMANASVSASIEDLMPGIYNIKVLYSGDQNFFNASNAAEVTVKKLNSDISVNASDITYGEDLIIDVTSSIKTGVVKAKVNNKEYRVNLTDGKGQFVVSKLNAGNYTITVTYLENELYYSSNATSQVTVNKKNSTISVTSSDIIYGENVVLNIDLTAGATGNLLISYGDTNRTIAVKTVERISGLDAGNYDIAVSYLGDNNFNPSQTTCSVAVNKKAVPLTVSYDDIVYGDSLNVTVAIDATGNVTINIGNRTLNLAVVDGKVKFTVDGLDAGNYSLTVNYAGDRNYFSNNTVSRVHVDKRETIINVKAANITYQDNYNLTLNINATGNVSVSIDNVTYIVEVVNNYAVVPVPVLNAGTYKVIVNYLGNVNYYSNDTVTYIYVDKKKTIINVEAENITYGNDVNITYNIEASGNVSISINNVTYIVRIVNNQAVLPIGVLNAGNYTVVINYYGDVNYYSNNKVTFIYIDKSVTTINVKADNIVFGDKKNMVINVNATGNVTVKINDVVYVCEIINNQVSIPVGMLNAGNYTVEIDYMGDINHYSNNTIYQLYIDKRNTTINVNCDDIIFGDDLNLTLNINATGNVNITIDNVTYTSTIVNNKTTFSIGTLNAGNYSVYIEYLGDTNYYSSNEVYDVTVNKRNTVININCDDIIFGDRLNITVNVEAVGEVAIDIANVTYYATVENNKASLSIANINAGNYTARIRYLGDRNYYSNESYYNVFVDKRNTTINVDCGDIVFGQTLNLTLNIKAEGNVNISIANKTYQAEIVNNTVELFIGNLTAGDYTMVINYYESANYYSSNVTHIVKIDKKQSDLVISAENIVFGEDLTVYVNTDVAATGSVLVIIDDKPYNLTLINGAAQVTVSGLGSGNYTIAANYSGDNNFISTQNSSTVLINKAEPNLNIDASDITYGEDLVVNIQTNVLATGNLTVTVDDESYVVNLTDGFASVTVSGLSAGDYSIVASYIGDGNFVGGVVNDTVNVIKSNMFINVAADDIYYGETLLVTVSLPSDISGSPIVTIDGESKSVTVTNGVGTVEFAGLQSGTYLIEVSHDGDGNYLPNSVNGTVCVNKVIITSDNFTDYVDENGQLKKNLPELIFKGDFSGVTFNINKQVTLIGQDATFINTRFLVNSDNVTIENMLMTYAGTDSIIVANGVSNFNLVNNEIVFTGQSNNNYAVNITGSTGVSLINNDIQANGIKYLHGIIISADDFTIYGNTLFVSSTENACGINIYGPSKGIVENNCLEIKAKKTVYSINTNPSTGPVQVRYINNTINSEAYFVVGIYDDSEIINYNKISLSGNYAIGIVVLSEGANVTGNIITLNFTKNGTDYEVHDDNVEVETSGIVVKESATIADNVIISSNKAISVVEGESEISGNTLEGQLSIESNGNIISGNIVNNENGYAIVLSEDATGNTIDGNELYSAQGNGNEAIDDKNGLNTITNNRINPALNMTIGNFEEGSTGLIVITANENFTGVVYVNITIGGAVSQTYEISVEKGNGNTIIKGLTAGNYTAEAGSVLNDKFISGHASCNFIVTKASPAPNNGQNNNPAPVSTPVSSKNKIKLTLKTVKVKKSAKKLVLQATLKINGKKVKGKIVKFKFNGKTYKAKTNKKGVAKVTIKKKVLKKLKIGKKVKYQVSYGGTIVKKSVKVKK